jgi:hypothetical protein
MLLLHLCAYDTYAYGVLIINLDLAFREQKGLLVCTTHVNFPLPFIASLSLFFYQSISDDDAFPQGLGGLWSLVWFQVQSAARAAYQKFQFHAWDLDCCRCMTSIEYVPWYWLTINFPFSFISFLHIVNFTMLSIFIALPFPLLLHLIYSLSL